MRGSAVKVWKLPPVPAPEVIAIDGIVALEYMHEVCGKLADVSLIGFVPSRTEGTYPETGLWAAEDN
jgi:hypothetical protein